MPPLSKKTTKRSKSTPSPTLTPPKRTKRHKKQPKSTPTPLKGTAEYKRLYEHWQKKLKASGFNDIEAMNTRTGEALELINGMSLLGIANQYSPETETYYRRLRNFVTHNPHSFGNHRLANKVAAMYVEGASYRDCVRRLKQEYRLKTSVWTIHKLVKQLELKSNMWNKVHPEGIDFSADIG